MNVGAKLVGDTSDSCWDSHLWSQTAYSMDKKKEDVLLRKLKCKILATISRFKFTKSRIFSHLHVIVMEMSLEEDALLVSFFFFCIDVSHVWQKTSRPHDPRFLMIQLRLLLCSQVAWYFFFLKDRRVFASCHHQRHPWWMHVMNNAYGSWNKLKSNCSCKYISILDSNAFSAGMFMKFNYPPQNKTNMKKVGTLHAICRKMDRLWRIWFFFPPLWISQ